MLPNAEAATVDPAKVRDYLLSKSHPVGRFKEPVFAALGYTQDRWQTLSDDLVALTKRETALPGQPSEHGKKFEVSGKLTGPNGRTALFKTVWIIRFDDPAPRFITAHPR